MSGPHDNIASAADNCRLAAPAPSFHEQVENLAFVATRAPEPELRARDRYGHLVKMPSRRWPRVSTAKLSGEQGPELQDPSPHRLVGDIQTSLSKQIFDVAIDERETNVELDGMPDYRRRKLMASKRDRHPPPYPSNGLAPRFA